MSSAAAKRAKCNRSLLKSELTYDNGAFFASANVNYSDERFYTYLNQGSVDAYTLVNLAAGYRFRGVGMFEELSIQLDATNLTDKEYFSTIDSNGFTETDPTAPGSHCCSAPHRSSSSPPRRSFEAGAGGRKRSITAHRSKDRARSTFAAVLSFELVFSPGTILAFSCVGPELLRQPFDAM